MKVSFCHYGNEGMASYRYRARIPAQSLGADINNPNADVIIFAKPIDQDVPYVVAAQKSGRKVIADFCDMHFHLPYYDLILKTADAVTCTTKWFSDYIGETYGIEAHVVPDPFEFEQKEPHCSGARLLWFGQGANIDSLIRVAPTLSDLYLTVVSNIEGAIPWSIDNLKEQFAKSDIVLMPETAPYKSPNRTIEAIRQGCFVVAEPHPAINDIPGIWVGNIRDGIDWAQEHLDEANARTMLAQAYIRRHYSPEAQANAWRGVLEKVMETPAKEMPIDFIGVAA